MGRSLGIDLGIKRVGIALSDNLNMIASPLKTLTYDNKKDLLIQLNKLIFEFDVEIIVLGLPLNMSGTDSLQTKKIRDFKSSLSVLKVPIIYEDERLSSVSAKRSMVTQNIKTGHNKAEIDMRAAAIILQQYLDKINS